jgi:two-component system sensor histidine kinase PilS (NtrC family)
MGLSLCRGAGTSLRTITTFLWLRAIALTLIVGAGVIIVQISGGAIAAGPLYVLLVLGYVAGAVWMLGLRLGIAAAPAAWTLMIADVLIAAAIVHYSGGATSQFSLVFGLPIIAAGVLLQVRGGLGIALLASAIYAGYGVLEAEGVLRPVVGTGLTGYGATSFLIRAYMHVSLFFVVGAFAGYLAQGAGRRGRQLAKAESKLEQLRVDTDKILEHMSSGVLVTDSEGTILTANQTAEHILGVDRDDIVGLGVEAAFDPLMPEFAGELLGVLESGQGKLRHEITVRRHDESMLPLGLSTSILKDEDGSTRGVIAVFKDLTEVREMEERMRRADRLAAIGELSAGIAHEIRNPLASISGSIEVLYNELDLDGDDKHLMELVMKESDRLNKIISDFLEFARLKPPRPKDVSLSKCLEEVRVLLGNNPATKPRVDIVTRHVDGEIVVEFDEEQLKQVMLNLAINACEAMRGSGKLVVETTRKAEDRARIVFVDEGPGMSGEARVRLFEPFFTTKEGGTGLGLAIANRIVEAHGGCIEARNRTERGAEFSVEVPVRARPQEESAAEEASAVGCR